jgi:putative DNA-invertase from lambdoid prophage Rac
MILGYCRVSTTDQASDDRTSLAEQERVIRGLAMMRGASSRDIAIFSDPGVSGSTPLHERVGGAEMLAAARKGDTIVACKLDRMFRSASDALATAEQLKSKGIDLVLVNMGNDPVTANGTAKLFFSMLAAFAEFERTTIVERITGGLKAKKANGGFCGGEPPYGFRKVGKGRSSTIVPEFKEQEVIALIHELAKTETSHHRIAKQLYARHIYARNRGKWQHNQVGRILKRELLYKPMELAGG